MIITNSILFTLTAMFRAKSVDLLFVNMLAASNAGVGCGVKVLCH